MSFRDSLVLNSGSYQSNLGQSDYLQLPKVSTLTKYGGNQLIKGGQIKDFEGLKKLCLKKDAEFSMGTDDLKSEFLVCHFLDRLLILYLTGAIHVPHPLRIPFRWLIFYRTTLLLKYGIFLEKNDQPVTLIVPITWSNKEIERATQILFESLNIPALYLLEEPLAIMYGTGILSALVVDIGHSVTDITPIYDNTPIGVGKRSIPIGGADINAYLSKLWPNKHSPVTLTKIKKEACVVSAKADALEASPVSFTVDGQSISLGVTRSKCCEVLFNPSLVGKTCMSIPEAIYASVYSSLEPARRSVFFENIILAGGCANLKGLSSRIEKEVQLLISCSETANEYQAKELKFIKTPDYMSSYKDLPTHVGFLGGTIVSKLAFGTGGIGYISKQEYNQYGPHVSTKALTF